MPIPSFSPIIGTNSEEILDSLEKQRKELQWLLQHLDTTNVKELNAEVINAGRISAKYLKVGSETEFEDGYDTRALFEVTNDRITLEVEELDSSIATLNIRADSITQSVTDLKNNLSSRITQTASEIRSEVSAQVTTINNNMQTVRNDLSIVSQTASQIQSTVTSQQNQIGGLGTRMSTAESNITQNAYQIQSKVSITDFTGSTIVSKINQDPYSVTIDAQRINLKGAVMVDGDISGATDINVSRNISIGNQIRFSDMTTITTGDGGIEIQAWNGGIDMVGGTTFYQTVDFRNATVIGLEAETVQGLYIAYNSTYVYIRDRYGKNVAQLKRSD